VELAHERSRGTGLQEERWSALEEERRTARHAGFGSERAQHGERAAPPELAPSSEPGLAAAAAAPPADPARAAARTELELARPLLVEDAATSAGAVSEDPAPTSPGSTAGACRSTPIAPAAAAAIPVQTTNARPVALEARALELPPLAAGVRAGPERGPRTHAQAELGSGATPLERAQEILRQIQLHVAPGVRRLAFELEPGDLGRLAIQLTSRQGKVSAIVRAERPETLELLALQEDELRALLARRGITTDSVRLELGFGGERSSAGARAAFEPQAEARQNTVQASSLPAASAALVDTYA